ncbi:MAG: efflux RND transporter permease subunit, partial [Candidatus Omnitrophica bacterium]|nr:efflux RND transporter permease subunit [Candidatus Omnitrophota bacterium]
MSLPRLAVRRPVTTLMIVLGVLLLGVIAWTRMPQELFPPITYPQLTVVTHYKDAAPEEIEILVTKPIEEVVGTVSGLRKVSSISKEEVSLVIAEFNWGINMDFAALGVREKIDLIKERLPRGSEDPVVIKYNPFELPVLVLNVTGEMSPQELLSMTRKQIKTELEKVEGIAAVNVSGGLEREILVEVDQGRLQASALPISQVVDAVSKANLNYPAGTIKEAFYEYLIRTMGEFRVVPEIPGIAVGVEEEKGKVAKREKEEENRPGPLKREKGISIPQRMILMKDVATVKDTVKDKASISRVNGKENVSLRLQKQAGANTLQVANRIREAISLIRPTLPPGVELSVAYDQSLFIRSAINGVREAALQGGFLAFLVLLAFLWNPWVAMNVAFAIPISIMSTIGLMYFGGITINVISLGGLALGIGLLVDAGIVVVENIARHREMGKPPKEAAVEGTEEVTNAIFGTVLTTVVVFLPMVFVVGIAGQLFKELAYTVTISNLASLLVSLSLTALFASRILRGLGRSPLDPAIEGLGRVERGLVAWFLRHRFFGVLLVVGLFAGSVGLLGTLEQELMPRVDQGQ